MSHPETDSVVGLGHCYGDGGKRIDVSSGFMHRSAKVDELGLVFSMRRAAQK